MRYSLTALLCAALVPALVQAKTPEQIFEDASKSIVVIHAYGKDGNPKNQGSGVVIAREAVITNCHVLEDAAKLDVMYQLQTYEATIRAADDERDLCELKVERLAAPATRVSSSRLKVGQRVYAIGAPEGLELTISEGLISSIREFDGAQYIQTSAPISSGSSGGGLFDTEARLIGITAFIVPEGQNINFALPAAWIKELTARSGTSLGVARSDVSRDKWSSRIAELRAKSEWMALLAVAQQWVRAVPTSVKAWEELGDAYLKVNRPRRALTAYERAVRLDGDAYDAWLNMGNAYLAVHQYDRALNAYGEALRIKASDVAALSGVGAAYHLQNRADKVREIHGQLVRLDVLAAREFARKYLRH